MKVVFSMSDHNGTVFGVKKRITPSVKDELTSHLKKFGDVASLEDDYTFLVIHDADEVSAEDIKQAIEELSI